jgi:hypothetical protein
MPISKPLVITVRVLLVLAAAVSVLYVVIPMTIGSQGLNLTNNLIRPLNRERVMSIEVIGTKRLFDERMSSGWPAAFEWKDSSNGTVDAVTGKPPVELFMFDRMQLNFWGPTRLDRWAYAGPSLATALLTLAVLFLLYQILGSVPKGEVFSRANARRMLWIAAIVGIGGSAVQLIEYAAHQNMVDHSAAAGLVEVPFHFGAGPLLAGVLILVLAEVFRQGVRLRDDVAGLV